MEEMSFLTSIHKFTKKDYVQRVMDYENQTTPRSRLYGDRTVGTGIRNTHM